MLNMLFFIIQFYRSDWVYSVKIFILNQIYQSFYKLLNVPTDTVSVKPQSVLGCAAHFRFVFVMENVIESVSLRTEKNQAKPVHPRVYRSFLFRSEQDIVSENRSA